MARIIALQACRHGLGCSHLAANLAVILMYRGYRIGLLDTDLKAGGIRTLFGLDGTLDADLETYWWIHPVPDCSQGLKADSYHSRIPYDLHSPGIYLPSWGSYVTTNRWSLSERDDQDTPSAVLQTLSDEHALDFLLIDTQPDLSDTNLVGVSLADIAIVLTQLNTVDLQRTAVLLEIIQHLQVPKTWLVPSLVLSTLESPVVQHLLEKRYHYPIAEILYLSEEMMDLASRGIFCLHHPDHALTKAMRAIAHQIEQDPINESIIAIKD